MDPAVEQGPGSGVTEPRETMKSSTKAAVEVQIFTDPEELSLAAARLFARASAECTASKREFSVAISGGSTPRNLYLLLDSGYYMRAIDWQHIHVFWTDERCVPPDHEQSNYKLALDTFLSKVRIPSENVHRIKGEEAAESAADGYEAALRGFFGEPGLPALDLILLGVGEDGHTASLFPGSPALAEQEHLAVTVRKQPPDFNRISLTLPVLNNARHVTFLVSGKAKAPIVQQVLEIPEANVTYPAAMVSPSTGRLTWIIDRAAAALLSNVFTPAE
jgi:6-phosphogluconolactonase